VMWKNGVLLKKPRAGRHGAAQMSLDLQSGEVTVGFAGETRVLFEGTRDVSLRILVVDDSPVMRKNMVIRVLVMSGLPIASVHELAKVARRSKCSRARVTSIWACST